MVGANGLHQFVRILLYFTQFRIRRQFRYAPYGPWDHVSPHVWTDVDDSDCPTTNVDNDVADVCVLCGHRCKTTVCGDCKEHYCDECLDPHTCGSHTVHVDE